MREVDCKLVLYQMFIVKLKSPLCPLLYTLQGSPHFVTSSVGQMWSISQLKSLVSCTYFITGNSILKRENTGFSPSASMLLLFRCSPSGGSLRLRGIMLPAWTHHKPATLLLLVLQVMRCFQQPKLQ